MSADLVWPAAWRRRRGTVVGLLLLMGLAAVVAVDAVRRGDVVQDGRVLIVVGLAPAIVAIGVVIALQHLTPRRVSATAIRASRADEAPSRGLVIPYRRSLAVARAVAAALVLAVGLVLVLVGIIGLVGGADGAVGPLLLGVIAVVGAAGPLVPGVKGRGGRRALVLTPDGVVHRSATVDVAAPWWAVVDVVPVGAVPAGIAIVCRPGRTVGATADPRGDVDQQSRRARWLRAWLDPTERFRPDVVVSGTDLAVDPVLVVRLVEFYVRHPESRGGLGTPSAVARAHAMIGN